MIANIDAAQPAEASLRKVFALLAEDRIGGRLKRVSSLGALLRIALLSASVAGCSGGFGIRPQQAAPATDPNTYPQNYRKQIAVYLSLQLSDRADFRGARISQPVLMAVGGTAPRYVVCLQFNGRSQIKDRVVIYLAGEITQFIDSTPDQCSNSAYQPFAELEQLVPDKANSDVGGGTNKGDGDRLQ
jgi:hypothetical protein